MALYKRSESGWNKIQNSYIKTGNNWKENIQIYVKNANIWKPIWKYKWAKNEYCSTTCGGGKIIIKYDQCQKDDENINNIYCDKMNIDKPQSIETNKQCNAHACISSADIYYRMRSR